MLAEFVGLQSLRSEAARQAQTEIASLFIGLSIGTQGKEELRRLMTQSSDEPVTR